MLKIVLVFLAATIFAVSSYNFEEIISNMPENERVDFLRHHINLGYTLTQNNPSYSDNDFGEDFSIQLYQYAKDNHNINDAEALKKYRNVICFDDGTCIDIGDIGVHP